MSVSVWMPQSGLRKRNWLHAGACLNFLAKLRSKKDLWCTGPSSGQKHLLTKKRAHDFLTFLLHTRDMTWIRSSGSALREARLPAGMFSNACCKLAVSKLVQVCNVAYFQSCADCLDEDELTVLGNLQAMRSPPRHYNRPCIPHYNTSRLHICILKLNKRERCKKARSEVPLSPSASKARTVTTAERAISPYVYKQNRDSWTRAGRGAQIVVKLADVFRRVC